MDNPGVIISLLIIFGGLVWLLIRSVKGREVDRRIIFIFIFCAVSAPILFPIEFEEHASEVVKDLFDRIEDLPPGSHILISFDFDPPMAPEVQPMADAISRHALAKGHKVVFMGLWATGQTLLTNTLRNTLLPEFPDLVDGVDYINLGYKAGNEGVLNVIVGDFKKMFPTDVNGMPLDSTEIFKDIRSAADFDLIVALGGGKPGPKEWVLFVGDPANVPIGVGVAAVVAPQLYPYYPRRVVGILGGVKGAAEYESELARTHPRFENTEKAGLKMMGPQTLAHVVIMAFIIIGNLAYFMSRRRKRG